MFPQSTSFKMLLLTKLFLQYISHDKRTLAKKLCRFLTTKFITDKTTVVRERKI